ncbi:MAG: AraC family transcriptional regulator, partial [Planctomycetota bacterium]
MSTPLGYLRGVLARRLTVLEARRHRFLAGWQEAPAWINSSRLIFVLDGRVDYTVGGATRRLGPGAAILVPLDAERSWVVPTATHAELAWFRYVCPDGDEPRSARAWCLSDGADAFGGATVDRMVLLLHDPTPARQLVAEGEAKALLARFLAEARPLGGDAEPAPTPSRGDLAVNHAVLWINEHYAEPDVLQTMEQRLPLSTAHFRKLFKRQMGCPPRDYLTRRRMQVARYALYHRDEQVKQV